MMGEYSSKYIHHFFILLLSLLIRTSNGALCTKWIYGHSEDDYLPVLVKEKCAGYGNCDDIQCQLRCDMGCPPNSHCEFQNVCVCDKYYEVNETYFYYGEKAVKSCRIMDGLCLMPTIYVVCIFACCLIIIGLLVIRKQRKRAVLNRV